MVVWWWAANYTDVNEGLVLRGGTTPTKRYYTFGNYSRSVRPGYTRVEISGEVPEGVLLSARRQVVV